MNGSVFNAFLSLCSDYGRLGANPQKSGASPLNDLVLQLVAGSFKLDQCLCNSFIHGFCGNCNHIHTAPLLLVVLFVILLNHSGLGCKASRLRIAVVELG